MLLSQSCYVPYYSLDLSSELINTLVFAAAEQQIVNRGQLADVFGANEAAIRQWRQQGICAQLAGDKGVENQFHVATCVAWLLGREFERLSRETPRSRLDRVRGDMAELEFNEKAGALVPVDAMFKTLELMITACRTQLLNLPMDVANELASTTGVQIDESIIQKYIERALTELAKKELDEKSLDNIFHTVDINTSTSL